MNIISRSIRIINRESQAIVPIDIPEAFDAYTAELINHIRNNTTIREYKTHSASDEVISAILSICANFDNDIVVSNKMDAIATRLLWKEIDAQDQIQGTNTTVQKGSLIQALLFDEENGGYTYLLAKVEHTEWVNDEDFTFKTGFSTDKKTLWKSCLFELSDLTADIFYAKLYSNTRAQYWSKGFLELDEVNTDEKNTQSAFQAIEATLGRGFKGITSPDHTILRNSFISYFKKHDFIDYPVMVNSIMEGYQVIDTNLTPDEILKMSERIDNIRVRMLEQPTKKGFDSQFHSIGSVINAKIRRTYPLNVGIELKVSRDIDDLKQTISAFEEDGVQYIRIRTNNKETYSRFYFKNTE